MINSFTRRNPHKFWRWFASHQKEFLKLNDQNYNDIYLKIYKYLYNFNPYLAFDLQKNEESSKIEIVFTANGNPHLFPTIFNLVDSAPRHLSENWSFIALRQANITDIVIQFDDLTIKSENIFYELEKAEDIEDKWDLFLYIEGVVYDSEEVEIFFAETMFAFLDRFLGEYLNTTKINELILVDKGELKKPKSLSDLPNDVKKQ